MEPPAWLWIVCTIAAAGAQTLRNAMQRSLIDRVGTVGATHVRFLFGLPFGLAFLASVLLWGDAPLPALDRSFGGWVLLGAVIQMVGTALMLAAMRAGSFILTTAYVKTEPVLVALFAVVFLGELLGPGAVLAIVLATVGVIMMSLPSKGAVHVMGGASTGAAFAWRPMLLGIGAGALFAMSAVGYRGAVVALGDAPFLLRASTALASALLIQTTLLSIFLLVRDRHVLAEIFRAWRPSLGAGFMGAFASALWLLAFTLQAAAPVRTLGLVEILFAQAVSRRLFAQSTRPREAIGIGLVVIGVVLLLNA